MFAAAGMLMATGDRRFNEAFEMYFDDIDGDPSAYRFNVYASLVYLRAATGDPARQVAIRSRLRQHADRALGDARAHPFEWAVGISGARSALASNEAVPSTRSSASRIRRKRRRIAKKCWRTSITCSAATTTNSRTYQAFQA